MQKGKKTGNNYNDHIDHGDGRNNNFTVITSCKKQMQYCSQTSQAEK